MSLFTPKLEAGERVVLRSPSGLQQILMSSGWFAFPLIVWLGMNLTGERPFPNDPQAWLMLKFYAGIGTVLGLLYFAQFRWRLLVTDRRLVIRRGGWLRPKFDYVPLSRVNGLRYLGSDNRFRILCDGEAHDVDAGSLQHHELHKALKLPEEAGKIYETDLNKILQPGERVVHRSPGGLWAGWWVATDRRLLYFAPGQLVQEMQLPEIREIVRQPYVPVVSLRGADRQIDIRCFDSAGAEQILAALRPSREVTGP